MTHDQARNVTRVLDHYAHLGRFRKMLDQAFPVDDDTDKTLRFWTADDYRRWAEESGDPVSARTARRMIAALHSRGVTRTEELFPVLLDGEARDA